MRLVVFTPGGRVIGVQVNGEHVRGVEELLQKREVWAAPAFADQLVRELFYQVVEFASGVLAVSYRSAGFAVVADFPGLGHDAV